MLISFRGGIGSGKTTAANRLIEKFGFVRVSFADPLKVEVFNFLLEHGHDNNEIWAQFRKDTDYEDMFPVPEPLDTDADKIKWVNSYKAALRPLLQWWGTEYRRAQNKDYWVDKAETYMLGFLTEGKSIVMDDCRFDNELELVAALGGLQVFIDCPNAEKLALERSGGGAVGIVGHESEKLLDKEDPRNAWVIFNRSTLEEFLSLIDAVVRSMAYKQRTVDYR